MEYFGINNYLTYVAGAFLIVLLPGPNSLYVLALSAQQGVKNGWAAATGVFVGDTILMLLTAAGAVTVLNAYPALFLIIKYTGAAYLVYLGIKLLHNAWQSWKNTPNGERLHIPLPAIKTHRAFSKALLVSLLNPKAILFFLSFFVQFVDPHYPMPVLSFMVLGLTLQFFSLCYLAVLIYAGDRLAETFRQRRRISAVSGGGIGLGFMAFAVKLALASA